MRLALLQLMLLMVANTVAAAAPSPPLLPGKHGSNHALIVSSSRYWFNYRHVVNALSIYQLCKSNGIPDENIVLMLAGEELPTNGRNPYKNTMTADGGRTNLYSNDIEIDYRGDEVTVDNLVRVLLGQTTPTATATAERDSKTTTTTTASSSPMTNRRALHSDEHSHVLIYWTGHGGDNFFKFQDVEEITAAQIAQVLKQMQDRKRYKELLFIADTCQAFTLGDALAPSFNNHTNDKALSSSSLSLSPPPNNVYMVGSSLKHENSYAHHSDPNLGLSVIERYTNALVTFLEGQRKQQGKDKHDYLKYLSLQDGLVNHLKFQEQRAHVGYRDHGCERKFDSVPMSDFFANVQRQNTPPLRPLYPRDVVVQEQLENVSAKDIATLPLRSSRRQNKSENNTLVNNHATCSRDQQETSRFQGLEPSDGFFLTALVCLVGVVVIASRFAH